jgi:hypothetical protein
MLTFFEARTLLTQREPSNHVVCFKGTITQDGYLFKLKFLNYRLIFLHVGLVRYSLNFVYKQDKYISLQGTSLLPQQWQTCCNVVLESDGEPVMFCSSRAC